MGYHKKAKALANKCEKAQKKTLQELKELERKYGLGMTKFGCQIIPKSELNCMFDKYDEYLRIRKEEEARMKENTIE